MKSSISDAFLSIACELHMPPVQYATFLRHTNHPYQIEWFQYGIETLLCSHHLIVIVFLLLPLLLHRSSSLFRAVIQPTHSEPIQFISFTGTNKLIPPFRNRRAYAPASSTAPGTVGKSSIQLLLASAVGARAHAAQSVCEAKVSPRFAVITPSIPIFQRCVTPIFNSIWNVGFHQIDRAGTETAHM